jgi:hypothetical protein
MRNSTIGPTTLCQGNLGMLVNTVASGDVSSGIVLLGADRNTVVLVFRLGS